MSLEVPLHCGSFGLPLHMGLSVIVHSNIGASRIVGVHDSHCTWAHHISRCLAPSIVLYSHGFPGLPLLMNTLGARVNMILPP
jgi:hypothetical protein